MSAYEMTRQALGSDDQAFRYYLRAQRERLDDHNIGLRNKTLDAKIMSDIKKLLEDDTPKEDLLMSIRMMLASSVAQPSTADDILESSSHELATFAARTLLMVNVGPLVSEPNLSMYVTWNGGNLRDCIATYFSRTPNISVEGFKLPQAFDALRIERLAGVRISFTDSLGDHLRLEEGDDDSEIQVLIFHHATFLKRQGPRQVT